MTLHPLLVSVGFQLGLDMTGVVLILGLAILLTITACLWMVLRFFKKERGE